MEILSTMGTRSLGQEIGLNTLESELETHLGEVVDAIFSSSAKVTIRLEDMVREINLEALTIGLGLQQTEYEPEQFPGLIYRPSQYEVTLLIFASGKIIIVSTTTENTPNPQFSTFENSSLSH